MFQYRVENFTNKPTENIMSDDSITKLNRTLLCIYQDNAVGNRPPISQFNGELLLKLVAYRFVELWSLLEFPEPLVSITESGKKYLKKTIVWKQSIAGPDSDSDTNATEAAGESFLIDPKAVAIVGKEPADAAAICATGRKVEVKRLPSHGQALRGENLAVAGFVERAVNQSEKLRFRQM